jgi:hypothetical protein
MSERCFECGEEVEIDGDFFICRYTGGHCPPGGCDCGKPTIVVCEDHQ